ncbi:MAG: FecR domain-containing protein [Candidatus Omnitrophica bacterium]|nr:FecR domain-containing protein [Candidatus Omnitrophota bacterium]
MEIQGPQNNSGSKKGIAVAGVILLLIAGIAYYLFSSGKLDEAVKPASDLAPLEVANFIGKPEFYSRKEKQWMPLKRGSAFEIGDKIRTDANSEVDLKVSDQISMRLKGGSEMEREGEGLFKKELMYKLHLMQGTVLGSTQKEAEENKILEISTPTIVAAVRGTIFVVRADSDTKESWVGVLRGHVEVSTTEAEGAQTVNVGDMQSTTYKESAKVLEEPKRISREEWDNMKEAYELIEKSMDDEAEQLDLAKEAGGLFDYVIDHGTFFTPKVGYAWRKFVKNPASGKVTLEVEYDVFPRGSFVGMYIKARDLDAQKFDSLQFQVARVPETGFPDGFRIEIKSKRGVIRTFAPKVFKSEWQTMRFPFRINDPTLITEITFVFSHDQAGEFTRGALQFQDIRLIPRAEEEPAASAQQQS